MRTCVFLADGFEEIEGLTVVDILRRAGVEVTTVSVMGRKMIQGAHGIPVEADCLFEEAQAQGADLLVLPGRLDRAFIREASTMGVASGNHPYLSTLEGCCSQLFVSMVHV